MAISIADRYRPTSLAEVVGQTKACAVLQRYIDRGQLGGRAYWISGPSGCGKTTLARIIADTITGGRKMYWQEVDAGELLPSRVREIEADLRLCVGQAFIVNEAHGLRKDTTRRLLDALERIPHDSAWIFTTTSEGEQLTLDGIDGNPLLSRCTRIAVTGYGVAKPFAERAKKIAEAEGLDGQPLQRYVKLVQNCGNNFRAVLQAIDSGIMIQD